MNVLILGDSHTAGFYGQELERLFKDRGDNVTRVGRIGATANSYLSGGWKKLQGTGDFDSAALGTYDFTVLSLGTNDAAGLTASNTPQAAASAIKRLADSLHTKALVYVGPPSFSDNAAKTYNPVFKTEDLNSRADRLWQVAAPQFTASIDPRAATKSFTQQNDVHFKADGGKAWAQFVWESLQQKAAAVAARVTSAVTPSSGSVAPIIGAAAVVAVAALLWWRRRKS